MGKIVTNYYKKLLFFLSLGEKKSRKILQALSKYISNTLIYMMLRHHSGGMAL
jgi:hypothetical protein